MAFNNAVLGPGLCVAGRGLETILQSQNAVATGSSGPRHSTPSDSLHLVTQSTAWRVEWLLSTSVRDVPAAGAAFGGGR